VVNLFFEPSTRTKNSFSLAEKRLSADVVSFSAASSSLNKGESLKDTIQNLCAMKMDVVVMRHPTPGSVKMLADFVDAVIINAGDGTHEHPTQALLDMMSIKEKFGEIQDLNVAIIGDIKHSRVALSNIYGLKTMGANVMLCAPPTFIPFGIESMGVKITYDIDEALEFADAVNVLRIQKERQGKGLIPTLREYRKEFGLTRDRIADLKKPLTIMHPGPMNRQVEIDSEIADGENAIILDQVLNGVAVRMAILFLLSGS
jgi:aspartate carbamoyltransferase catalytic subunit